MLGKYKNTGFFSSKDMQTPTPPFSFAPILMINADSAELNEKLIFRVLYFKLWLIVSKIYQKFTDQSKKLFKSDQIF